MQTFTGFVSASNMNTGVIAVENAPVHFEYADDDDLYTQTQTFVRQHIKDMRGGWSTRISNVEEDITTMPFYTRFCLVSSKDAS